MSLTVFLNGQFLPYEQATISVEDRAFLLADGIYEVVRVYGGRPFEMEGHLRRLARSARELKLPAPDLDEIGRVSLELLRINNLSDATIYIQVSRGAYAPRTHAFPTGPVTPTLLVIARSFKANDAQWETGIKAVTVPDQRWARCDIKSVSLLPNALAKQAAVEAGAQEAVFVKDGYAIEGSSSNFMAVLDGEIRTYPSCNYILSGITRNVVLDLARKLGYKVREEGIPTTALGRCTEMWVTSTTQEVMPIVSLDGQVVGDGRPGPVAQALLQAIRELL
ncbi:MAG TPA: D-amino acid aminotransferase [Symbiobacteriaceae bacterium]|jgi:D-alanine transaminase|nr:D-amino acid aminotransferase [Symbiobacteriaceae bacterium]